VHPTRGRSLTYELCRRDAELFRDANVNYIRTSHYPPSEEFLDACDELGFFVEEEAAINWVGRDYGGVLEEGVDDSAARHRAHIVRPALEMVQRDRSRPSILVWSLANESAWSANFEASARAVAKADPTRPLTFTYGVRNSNADREHCAIGAFHYPGPGGPAAYADYARPVVFDEFCHLETYNRREVVTDPGVRDEWGRGFAAMWDGMYASRGCLGGAIWSGIDDIFHLPSGRSVGYGSWGPIDGWRRPKPEYWHVKKTYSPVRILARSLPAPDAGDPIVVPVENRHDFTNLGEIRIEWSLGSDKGTAFADVPPRSTGSIPIDLGAVDPNFKIMTLDFISPRGFLIDTVRIAIGKKPLPPPPPETLIDTGTAPDGRAELIESDETILIRTGRSEWMIDRATGRIRSAAVDGRIVLTGGPELMILPLSADPCRPDHSEEIAPLNDACSGWKTNTVKADENANGVAVVVVGEYAEAAGFYRIIIDAAGGMTVNYSFEIMAAVNPRQAGLVFHLVRECDTLAWQREAQWTVYPDDHIGRPFGSARASNTKGAGARDIRLEPESPWALDEHPLGTADFRSTRSRIAWAALRAADGHGLLVRSDGSQSARSLSVRSFVRDSESIGLLVAGFSTGGADPFFATHLASERRPLKKGDLIADTVRLELIE